MKTLTEKIVDSIMNNIDPDISANEKDMCNASLNYAINDIIRTKAKFKSEVSNTLTPKLLSKIEELMKR